MTQITIPPETIKAEQIPDEVKRAMRAAWARRNNSDAPEKIMADLAVAAINSWPGMWRLHQTDEDFIPPRNDLILPLQETAE